MALSSVGESHQLVATVIDQNGDTMSDAAISWSATDSSIASVSPTGLVTARAAGAAQIVAIAGFATTKASVNVQIATLGTLQSLVAGLEYPKGLWVSAAIAYMTETAGHNTTFGGKERLLRYSLDSDELVPLLETSADAVVVSGDGTIYLASWRFGIPGEAGKVSIVDPTSLAESDLLELGVAATDMFLGANEDVYVTGTSQEVTAPSLSLLPAGDRANRDILAEGLRLRAITRIGSDTYLSQFSDNGAWAIIRRTESGTITEVVSNVGAVSSLTSDGTHLYFTAPKDGLIGRFDPLAPSPVIDTVASGLASPMTVRYVSSTHSLYFLTSGTAGAEYTDGTLGVINGLR